MARIDLNAWMRQEQGKHLCACGCGQCITIQRHHHARGIPQYRNGHCARVHNAMIGRTQALNPHYTGGRYTDQDGYIVMLNPERTGHQDRYIKEHRFIMAQHLGRRLTSHEHVHHLNGNKADNRIENLEILTVDEHARRHDEALCTKVGDAVYLRAKRCIHRREPYKGLLWQPRSS